MKVSNSNKKRPKEIGLMAILPIHLNANPNVMQIFMLIPIPVTCKTHYC